MKMSVEQALTKGRTLCRNGAVADAERVYREVLERFPTNKRLLAELHALTTPKIENPPQADLDALVALYGQRRLGEARDRAAALLERFPNGEILCNIAGVVNADLGRLDAAIAAYDHAVTLAPDYFEAYNNRGNALKDAKRFEEAIASFDAALALHPAYAEAHMNRGIALFRLRRLDEALKSYDRAIALNPGRAEAYNNRGNTLLELKRTDDALADFDKAVALAPTYADAYVNRGNALRALERKEEAVASYERAIAISPAHAEAYNNRGGVLRTMKRLDDALESYEQALRFKPDYAMPLSESVNLKAHLCDWADIGRRAELSRVGLAGEAVPPFFMLNIDDDAARQLHYSRTWAAESLPAERPVDFGARKDDGKIRIGYISADFHNHATLCLMGKMLELHDRDRFEIHAFSYGVNVGDRMRTRLLKNVDHFHDVGDLNDEAVAALARSLSIDIAIDLKGYTEKGRSGIFAYRPAPVSVNYLGYPGTMGADFIDYIIADRIIIPEDHQDYYSEKVLYMPHSYQVNDNARDVAATVYTRADVGLPEDAFVFCCFNNNYKISPVELDIWTRLLTKVEGSVLWLLGDNQWAIANLRREVEARGIDPARLIFADRAIVAEHMARHVCADLFLDTFNVNAHTTASDALWMGLPVVTKLGNSFVSRVAGSLLHAVDMPELVTGTVEDYEALALALATDPARLAAVRAKLAANRLTTPLYDTERFTRDIEAIYEGLYAEHCGVLVG